jgi:DNA-binding CsgD family transcriptional regulator
MNVVSFFSSLAFLIYAHFGYQAIRRNRAATVNWLFAAFAWLYALWSFEYAFMSSAGSREMVVYWVRTFSFSYTMSAPVFVHFALLFTRSGGKTLWISMPPLYALGATFMVNGWFETFLFSDFVLRNGIWIEINNTQSLWALFYTVFYYACVLAGLVVIAFWGKRSKLLRQKKQARCIVGGFLLTLLLVTLTNFAQHLVVNIAIPRMPHLATLVWVAAMSYAMHHFDFLGAMPASAASNRLWNELTAREQQIVAALLEGLTYKQAAARLHISPNTIKSHIEKIYQKLHVNSRAQLSNLLYAR